jgi:hypothetical protein
MRKKNLSLLLLLSGTIVSMVSLTSFENNNSPFSRNAYGHNFTPNESASFLSFVDQLQVESELVQTSLANNNTALAQEHATRAMELLKTKDPVNNVTWTEEIAEENQRIADDLVTAVDNLENTSSEQQQQPVSQLVNDIDAIIGEAVTARIDQEQRDNATIQALAFAHLVDSILRNYGNAYGVGFDMTNMSNMAGMMDMIGSNNSSSSLALGGMADDNNSSNMNMASMNMSSSTMMNMDSEMDRNYQLVNTADYQSAQALAAKALEIFKAELRSMVSNNNNNNTTSFITNLENGLIQLNNSIRSKASPMDIMMIVHTQVHPNLMQAFNLQLG